MSSDSKFPMNSDGERGFVSARERRTLESFSEENNSLCANSECLLLPAWSLPRVFKRIPLGFGDYDTCPCFLLWVFPSIRFQKKGKKN
jgi:hypothetical protein